MVIFHNEMLVYQRVYLVDFISLSSLLFVGSMMVHAKLKDCQRHRELIMSQCPINNIIWENPKPIITSLVSCNSF